jgi:hypothetical protein
MQDCRTLDASFDLSGMKQKSVEDLGAVQGETESAQLDAAHVQRVPLKSARIDTGELVVAQQARAHVSQPPQHIGNPKSARPTTMTVQGQDGHGNSNRSYEAHASCRRMADRLDTPRITTESAGSFGGGGYSRSRTRSGLPRSMRASIVGRDFSDEFMN